MLDTHAVNEAIAAAGRAIDAAGATPLVRFENERLDVDAGGSDAVYVTAVLKDHPGTYGWTELKPIDDAVWREFLARGIARIPYVSFRQEHDTGEDEGEFDDVDATERAP